MHGMEVTEFGQINPVRKLHDLLPAQYRAAGLVRRCSPADGILGAGSTTGLRHVPLAANSIRYIIQTGRQKGHSPPLATKSSTNTRRTCVGLLQHPTFLSAQA
jgi:hypothetical protein